MSGMYRYQILRGEQRRPISVQLRWEFDGQGATVTSQQPYLDLDRANLVFAP